MKANQVPNDLLPVHTLYLERRDWAASTFHHWSAFHVGTLPSMPTDDDLKAWKSAAADIMEELKALGVSKAQDKVVSMVNSYFTFHYKGMTFSSIYDVVDMLSDPDFYEKNVELVRDMLHMFQYGIFRSGYNAWAHDSADEWMRNRNIQYIDVSTGKQGRKGKGFVYKLIVNRASNSLCERLQNMSQRVYNEYVVVRDRKVKKFGNEYELQAYTFNYRFPGYLCKKKTCSVVDKNNNNTEMSRVMSLLEVAKSKGVTFDMFHNVMTKVVDDIVAIGKIMFIFECCMKYFIVC